MKKLIFLLCLPVFAQYPEATITNGILKATLSLPDPAKGYYQATRFDWSGQIPSLEYKGHTYFGAWNPAPYDPKLHDAIMGPVEEFLGADNMPVGYAEAKPGGTFIKLGVGVIRKPDDNKYNQFKTYEIVDHGKWTVKPHATSVDFIQIVRDPASGYAYQYTKTVRLIKGRPDMVLEHRLKNIGTKAIASDVYEHNFYMIDKQPTGPDVVVKFPFEVHSAGNFNGLAETKGKDLVYLKELQNRQSAASELTGFSTDVKDYDITEENTKTGAGVRQTSDRPLVRINYWSIRTTACPEAYIRMNIEPGKEFTWKINYTFYAK